MNTARYRMTTSSRHTKRVRHKAPKIIHTMRSRIAFSPPKRCSHILCKNGEMVFRQRG